MGAALSQDDPADGGRADNAWLSVAMIDAMQGCEVAGLAARVTEVRDGAAAMTDPGFQDGPNTPTEGSDLLQAKR